MVKRGEKPKDRSKALYGDSSNDELESLNADLRSRQGGAQATRRTIEGGIEQKAKKRRSREVPASAGFKKQV